MSCAKGQWEEVGECCLYPAFFSSWGTPLPHMELASQKALSYLLLFLLLHSLCSLSPTPPQEFQQSQGPTSQPGEAKIWACIGDQEA